jgi:hypothetical protein
MPTILDRLRPVAIKILQEHMGVAAEFAVDDAIADVKKNAAFSASDDLAKRYFFICLTKQLPASAPFLTIKEQILKALG